MSIERKYTTNHQVGMSLIKSDYKLVMKKCTITKRERLTMMANDAKDFMQSFFYEMGIPIIFAFVILHVIFIASCFILHAVGIL